MKKEPEAKHVRTNANGQLEFDPVLYFPPWCGDLVEYTNKAKALRLSWRRPHLFFKWLYYMRKAGKCIPKNMPMHKKLFNQK